MWNPNWDYSSENKFLEDSRYHCIPSLARSIDQKRQNSYNCVENDTHTAGNLLHPFRLMAWSFADIIVIEV